MASSVFYKFKSQKDESRVTFDGTGISVFELKRDIILANNLGKANDFDLVVSDSSSGQEYKDDSQIIPRSSSVIVRRLPSSRPGKGKAAMYIAGVGNTPGVPDPSQRHTVGAVNNAASWHKGAMSKRFDVKEEPSPLAKPLVTTNTNVVTNDSDEAAAMAAMFKAQTANWEETQEKMTHAVRVYSNPRGTGFSRGGRPHTSHQQHHPYQPERPLPPSYVCYRCGQKGHWIQDCPTNSDREFDNKPRIKRTTGIPRSMLKAVDDPNNAQPGQGVMVTPEGGYVVVQPDLAAWQKQVSRPKGLTVAEVRERPPTDLSLVCPIDNKLFRDAVKTPCCDKQYCEECVQTHLLERDFVCPNCGKKIGSLDKLVVDKPMRTKVNDYIDKAVEDSKKESDEASTSNTGAAPTTTGDHIAAPGDAPQQELALYSDQQPGSDLEMSQMVVDSIPQIHAQIAQISQMLQNPSLPHQVRYTTEMQYQQLQIQLQHAQTIAVALAAATSFQQQQQQQQHQQQQTQNGMQDFDMRGWNNWYSNQQSAGHDSAYQRVPVNNRRRYLKRERPSDFLEVSGDQEKIARYWE